MYDAHDPYDPPAPYKERFAAQPYDGEIAYADACVGKLLDALRKHGLYDETMIAVMADHGESLGAHGENTHGVFLYDETLHVPLLIKLPLNRWAGTRERNSRRAGGRCAHSACRCRPHRLRRRCRGNLCSNSCKRRMRKPPPRPKTAPPTPRLTILIGPLAGARCGRCARGKYLFIQAPERELYNQASDPAETHNLAGSSKAVTDTLASQLADFRNKTSQTLVDLAKPDPEKLQKLQALGYVGSDTAPVQDEKKLTGVDPKARIEISNLLHDAMFDVEDARYEQAIPLLERALAVQPEMPVANCNTGLPRPGSSISIWRSRPCGKP